MPRAPGVRAAAVPKVCEFCEQTFSANGLASHQKACKRKCADRLRDAEYERRVKQQTGQGDLADATNHGARTSRNADPESGSSSAITAVHDCLDVLTELDRLEAAGMDENVPPQQQTTNAPSNVHLDDIKVEFHPSSSRESHIYSFEEYGQATTSPPLPPNDEPWRPFRSRLDFEVAELALQAALNKEQVEALIQLLHRCAKGDEKFTLSSHSDVCATWQAASLRLTPFKKHKITVPYKKETRVLDVHVRSLWDWALDLLRDPYLAPHFVWDAQRLYKYNGQSFVRFYNEPWTANRFWNTQSALPPGGKPFCFILYADKTRLSSFGTAKGYPVVAHCANLPVEIRNGQGVGGGRVVGWLPIITEEAGETGKKGFSNFKRVVWHESFKQLLKSIEGHSKTGFWFECGDTLERHLFPSVIILSADYEEQCFMTLIRGAGGLFPCPVYLVPANKQSNILVDYPLRTAENSQRIVEEGKKQLACDREELLKGYGLRGIHNALWNVANSDPHAATCFDKLHAFDSGLWGDHLWSELQKRIELQGRKAEEEVDQQVSLFPTWRGLNHFDEIMKVSFSDGSKLEDISKIVLFAAHNVLTQTCDPEGYFLLCCIRSYIELSMYLAMDVHTSETLEAGRRVQQKFSQLMEKYAEIGEAMDAESDGLPFAGKNWNFPKMHTHKHAFDDIEAKGVTRNYNTKPNEKLHGPLKKSYRLRTNFKNIAEQILRADHWCLTSAVIREDIEQLDQSRKSSQEADSSAPTYVSDMSLHVSLGSKRCPISFSSLEENRQQNSAFKNFRKRLTEFMNVFLPSHQISLPEGRPIKFNSQDMVTEHCFLKVNYESTVDWRQTCDYLRCSPKFQGKARYDCVLVRTVTKTIFARLLFVFTMAVDGVVYPIALIHPFDAPVGFRPQKDVDLGFYRIRAKPRSSSEFISVKSIIRGALLVEDSEKVDHFLVVDTVDTDMFLRMKSI